MSEAQATNGAGANTLEAVVAAAHETAGAFSTLERQLRHSRSFHDVQAVDAGHALSPPPLKKLRKSQGSQSLLDTSLKAVQEDENEVAEVVVVCEPEGTLAITLDRILPCRGLNCQQHQVCLLVRQPQTGLLIPYPRMRNYTHLTCADACAVLAACALCPLHPVQQVPPSQVSAAPAQAQHNKSIGCTACVFSRPACTDDQQRARWVLAPTSLPCHVTSASTASLQVPSCMERSNLVQACCCTPQEPSRATHHMPYALSHPTSNHA
jgi:hypothetical protein